MVFRLVELLKENGLLMIVVLSRFNTNYNNFHNLRLYARGEQSVQKYKDELSINGDLSYLNLDWKPVPVIPKFVDIVVNGISQRNYDINAYAQDPESLKKRTNYASGLLRDMNAEAFIAKIQESTGADMFSNKDEKMLHQTQELEVHMQMNYKQSVEVAEEEAIENVLAKNKYDLINRRVNYDLTVLGIGAAKTSFNRSEGVTVDYVDPANLVYSYTEDPNFEDIYYVGEVKSISLPELKKEFPYLTADQLKRIQEYPGNQEYLETGMVKILIIMFKYYILNTKHTLIKYLK